MARIPKYRRHSTRDIGFVEHCGKRIYLPGPHDSGESLDAYRDFLRSIGIFIPVVAQQQAGEISLPSLVARYVKWAESEFSAGPRSYAANVSAAAKLLMEFTGVILAAEFGPRRMKQFQQWLADRGLSRGYVNDTCRHVRAVFKWAVSEELLPAESHQALKTVGGLRRNRSKARETAPRQPVAWPAVQATLPHLPAAVKAMVLLQWHTGVRPQAVCAATVAQFDRTTNPWLWRAKNKTAHLGTTLVVFVGPQARKAIEPLFVGRAETDYLFRPAGKTGKPSKRYRSHYDTTSYAQAIRRGAAAAKVEHWSPHQLRHARGTAIRERYGLEAAQAALGHARIDATQIYAKRLLDLAKQAAEETG